MEHALATDVAGRPIPKEATFWHLFAETSNLHQQIRGHG
jgi:hypothetical protein